MRPELIITEESNIFCKITQFGERTLAKLWDYQVKDVSNVF